MTQLDFGILLRVNASRFCKTTGVTGLTEATIATLKTLGAVESIADRGFKRKVIGERKS
jgi:hypothetical protein